MANWTDSLDGKRRVSPAGHSFFRRRLCEVAGLALFFAALLLAAALASYDHGDPSWNHAVDAPTRNWVGPYGATIADFLCQSFGAEVQDQTSLPGSGRALHRTEAGAPEGFGGQALAG